MEKWYIEPTFYLGQSYHGSWRAAEVPHVNGLNISNGKTSVVGDEGITDCTEAGWQRLVDLVAAPLYKETLDKIKSEISILTAHDVPADISRKLRDIGLLIDEAMATAQKPEVLFTDEDEKRMFF